MFVSFVFFFKQKTAYEMRISDWSSDVCSSDLSDLIPLCRLLFNNERAEALGERFERHKRNELALWGHDSVADADASGGKLTAIYREGDGVKPALPPDVTSGSSSAQSALTRPSKSMIERQRVG